MVRFELPCATVLKSLVVTSGEMIRVEVMAKRLRSTLEGIMK